MKKHVSMVMTLALLFSVMVLPTQASAAGTTIKSGETVYGSPAQLVPEDYSIMIAADGKMTIDLTTDNDVVIAVMDSNGKEIAPTEYYVTAGSSKTLFTNVGHDVAGYYLYNISTSSSSSAKVGSADFIYNVKKGDYNIRLRTYHSTLSSVTMIVTAPVEVPSSWAVADVERANSLKLVPDTLNSTYTQATTRAEFCTLAVALYENAKGKAIAERKTFTDTKDVSVEKAAAIGVVNGTNTEGTLFSPNTQLTREQAATMLSRLASVIGKPLPEQAMTFADNGRISSWATTQVGQAQAAGIMGGVGNNLFSPQGNYTREQSIITILRLYDVVK